MSFIFDTRVLTFLALAFDSRRDIVNNNLFDDLYEFIVILANAKKMTFVRQSYPNRVEWDDFIIHINQLVDSQRENEKFKDLTQF